VSYDWRDFLAQIRQSDTRRYAIDEAVYYFRNTNWRCIIRLHQFEFYYRPNYYRDDLEDGIECVWCGKEGEPLSWRIKDKVIWHGPIAGLVERYYGWKYRDAE